ncbi:MAG TPA: acyl-CoA dehydrogenase family protein [Candidatus Bathyarchaeia archaeon]|nr:acyl-CoA dehydrogenase family protein [Candidatus Bathyarchaeia archaeon]
MTRDAEAGDTTGMDLGYSKEDEAFRREVRAWLRKNLPRRGSEAGGDGEDQGYRDPKRIAAAKAWQRTLAEAGYVAMGWPREHGGQGASIVRQTILNEELVLHHAPNLIGMMGIQMVGPTLIQFGTDEQKRRYLPRILRADEIWCQGYSEPGSGSDLASLRTRAEIDGDYFVVNGQKVWTSMAQIADWMFCLVRTDPAASKHRGISYILIDMKSPGITVRPLVQMTGDPGFNEVFFNDVRVPRTNLVGELNDGWKVANATLRFERNMLASTTRTQQLMVDLVKLAETRSRDGARASRDPLVRQRLGELVTRVWAMKYHSLKQLSDEIHHRPPGIGVLVNKLVTTELNHDICTAALEILGNYGPLAKSSAHVVGRGLWPRDQMFTLGLIIGGGTSQIQKNIIAERGLGMPKGA